MAKKAARKSKVQKTKAKTKGKAKRKTKRKTKTSKPVSIELKKKIDANRKKVRSIKGNAGRAVRDFDSASTAEGTNTNVEIAKGSPGDTFETDSRPK